ncbi:hypothetical protein EV182_000035 [Spiromyces aspiralis]|uniref:Uncharacterized protein n=1 Tax=Spiromyces aspiralis TaxID=68401 RepID=A0ACC1HHS9_9FUNG|nr:hypothetical protein EV182_000035 [Spiromyces aspiralis]
MTGVSAPIYSLKELVARLHEVLGDQGLVGDSEDNVDKVRDLMNAYQCDLGNVAKDEDWRQFALYDGGRYTRNLIDSGNGKFNLLLLVWGEGQASPIHDHANSHCMMKLLDGELVETRYHMPGSPAAPSPNPGNSSSSSSSGPLEVIGEKSLSTNQVAYIHDKIGLHCMSNPDASCKAVSLHLYSPPFDLCRVFDGRTGAAKSSFCASYYSSSGKIDGQAQRCVYTNHSTSLDGATPCFSSIMDDEKGSDTSSVPSSPSTIANDDVAAMDKCVHSTSTGPDQRRRPFLPPTSYITTTN